MLELITLLVVVRVVLPLAYELGEAYERGECIPLEEVREHLLGSDSKALFDKLQEEVDRCVADMEQGNYHTREELMKRYGLL